MISASRARGGYRDTMNKPLCDPPGAGGGLQVRLPPTCCAPSVQNSSPRLSRRHQHRFLHKELVESDAAVTKEAAERETVVIEGLISMRIGSFSLSSPTAGVCTRSAVFTAHCAPGTARPLLSLRRRVGNAPTNSQWAAGAGQGISLRATVFPRLASV